jgi:hypothetical protein
MRANGFGLNLRGPVAPANSTPLYRVRFKPVLERFLQHAHRRDLVYHGTFSRNPGSPAAPEFLEKSSRFVLRAGGQQPLQIADL